MEPPSFSYNRLDAAGFKTVITDLMAGATFSRQGRRKGVKQ